MTWNDWTARLRASIIQHGSMIRRRPGLISLALITLVALLAMVWPAPQHRDAAARAARLAQETVQVTATPSTTPSPAATATPTATATTSATAPATVTDSTAITATATTPDAVHALEILAEVPPPPRGLAPRVNPRVNLRPAPPTPTPDPLALLLPTPTPVPTLSIVEALDQPVPTPQAGIGALLLAPTPEPPPAPQPTPALEPTPSGDMRSVRVPILMYHYLSVPPANADIYRRDLSVTPDLFAEHLDAMQAAGYTTISLYQWLAHLTQGEPLPEKPVVLTFDDGYRDNYDNALPLLAARGMVATFFIVTDFIDDQRPEYLTWDMVRAMYAAGMSIESHGRNHVSLAGKSADYLIWQALGSLETIEYELGVRPRFVSYPAGEFDQTTIDIFRSAHYWAGFTTRQGATHRSDDLFRVHRVRIRGTTSAAELLRLLALEW